VTGRRKLVITRLVDLDSGQALVGSKFTGRWRALCELKLSSLVDLGRVIFSDDTADVIATSGETLGIKQRDFSRKHTLAENGCENW